MMYGVVNVMRYYVRWSVVGRNRFFPMVDLVNYVSTTALYQ